MARLVVVRSSVTVAIGALSLVVTFGGAAASVPTSPGSAAGSALSARPTLGPGGRVIVLLNNRATTYNAKTAAEQSQARAARTTVADVAGRIRQAGGTVGVSYSLINAVAATVSQSEADALAADRDVAEVVPDERIRLTPSTPDATGGTAIPTPIKPPAGTCLPNGKVKLEPEALEATRADSDVPGAKTARSLGYTGRGVTVGWIADGIDINNPDFIRNGHTIFSDYRDFSGEGPGVPTSGAEAFLDASAIAAQGKHVYDVSKFSKLTLNQACNIRIEGEAPGVNLVGLNIFGEGDTGFNSSFIQAIQYAATVDHVNVLNESLGSNPYPDDNGSLDAVTAANDAAVALGVTITASSGDAGVTNTIGSPATDPLVISVGATTTYRFFLTTGYGGARLPGIKGWVSNNISSLSSGGFDQDGRTVDLVAPGELNFGLCSKDLTQYTDCADYAGDGIGVEASGGTSESAPTTAGVAALVIEAYRNAHHGASPSPALIKTILVSTADDIDAPADQQGAGLVDAYKAVLLAKSYRSTPRAGHTISSSVTQFAVSDAPGVGKHLTDTVTNSGTTAQTVHVSSRTLGGYRRIKTTSVPLSDAHSPKYVDFQGITDNVEKITFTVPAGVDRLNASIAFQNASTSLTSRVRMDLVDPLGRLASYSVPQGIGNYGNDQVANPVPGTWTAYITSRDSADGGTEGTVLFAAGVAKFVSFGRVSPSSLTLAPGASASVTLAAKTPAVPGDEAGSLVFRTSTATAGVPATTTVAVTLRAVVPAGRYTFQDTLTGGNGRGPTTGQEFYYSVDVPANTPELNATVTLASNPNNQFFGQLVAPSGNALATSSNNVLTTIGGGSTPVAANTLGSQLHVLEPAAGRWTLIVTFAPAVSGTAISQRFTVSTSDSAVAASAAGLPNSAGATIKAGTTKTVSVKVHNAGTSPEAFFIDARGNTSNAQALTPLSGSTTKEPLTGASNELVYLVPTRTAAMEGIAHTDGPADIQADMGYSVGDPDIESGTGKTVTMSYSAPRIGQGLWSITPTEVGPFATAGPAETVDSRMVVLTRTFDSSVTSSTGDLWLSSVDPSATLNTITVGPGETATIPVTITASGQPQTVSGTIYLDDAQLFSVLFNLGSVLPNGNEVAALPYKYTVIK